MLSPFNSFPILTGVPFGEDFPDEKTGLPFYKSNFNLAGHNGRDMIPHDVKFDKKIYNIHNGIIMFAGWDSSYGNRIKIWNKELKICEYYCHLEFININIKEGLELTERIYLGNMGKTGVGFGDHLHYQICRVDEKCNKLNTNRNDKDCIKGYIDPLPFLKE